MTNDKIAQAAFRAWEKGENTGDYQDFKNLLSPHFNLFSHPLQPARGVFKDSIALTKINELIALREKSPNNLKFSNIQMTKNQNTYVFIFDSEGKVGGGFSYLGWNIIVLIVEQSKVTGFREYFGDIEPNWFK